MPGDSSEDPTNVSGPAPRVPAHDLRLANYDIGDVIGTGGSGEVTLARDLRIGRDVALKRLKTGDPSSTQLTRFLREAKIQARLDHPAIVPVYELAFDPEGAPYFTMKRLSGTTLKSANASLQRSLRAFVDVCNAIGFAHSRGVVHRDLKPANIMLGEYGEVYVLDWGIARVIEESDVITQSHSALGEIGDTHTGAKLGTPGYMAPEQARDPAEAGPPADIYSLGAILFELLAGEPLGSRSETSPARRAPDRAIAPELDAVCVAALAPSPADRPAARELADRVQHYLDGDRDLERRRALATQQLALAHEAAKDAARQSDALRIAGRALALDPESKDAAALVAALILAPSTTPSPELEARLDELDTADAKRSARAGVYALLSVLLFTPLMVWNGIIAPITVLLMWVYVAVMAAFIRRFGGTGHRVLMLEIVMLAVMTANASRVLGPFLIAPSIAAIVTMGLLAHPHLERRAGFVLTCTIGSFVVPLVLEWVGVLDRTWQVTGGAVVSRSALIHVGGLPTTVLLVAGNIAVIAITGLYSRQLSSWRREAQRALETQAWRLRQLVPSLRLQHEPVEHPIGARRLGA